MKLQRNITLLFLHGFFIKRFAFPVITLYILSYSISFTQLGCIAAAATIASILTEIPGGIFADKYGKRLSLILASTFAIIYGILLTIGNGFVPFLVAAIFYGIGGAFLSGTTEAMLYDTLTDLHRKKEYKKVSGRLSFLTLLTSAAVLSITPLVYEYNQKLPFIISVAFFAISFVAAYLTTEPPKTAEETIIAPQLQFSRHLGEAFRQIRSIPYVSSIILLFTVVTIFWYIFGDYAQPLLQLSGLNIIYFGLFYTVLRVLSGLASEIAHWLDGYFTIMQSIAGMLCIILIGFITVSIGKGVWLPISMIIIDWLLDVESNTER